MSESPIDRPCSFCAADPGVPCNRPRGSRDGFHAARLSPAVRGALFSDSKNLVESRARGARRGAAKKKARAKKPEPRDGRVFSVWYYVATDAAIYNGTGDCRSWMPIAWKPSAADARFFAAALHSRSDVRRARSYMRDRFPDDLIRVVRVTVRVRA